MSLAEALMVRVLELLKADEVLKAEVRAFRLSEPLSLAELPLIYVQLSPSLGEAFRPLTASSYERTTHLDICVVVRHVEAEEADRLALRLAERVCQVLAANPDLGGLVEDARIERLSLEYGSLRESALARARITLATRVMWRA